MLWKLFALFFFVPLVELAVLIKLGQLIGVLYTILLVVITAILGAALTKQQGLKVWFRLKEELSRGALPGNSLLEALLIFIGGIVLLTPGLLTDSVGFFLLIPVSRRFTREFIKDWLRKMIQGNSIKFKS